MTMDARSFIAERITRELFSVASSIGAIAAMADDPDKALEDGIAIAVKQLPEMARKILEKAKEMGAVRKPDEGLISFAQRLVALNAAEADPNSASAE